MVGQRRNGEFTVQVKQTSDGNTDVVFHGFRTGKSMIAMMAATIQEFMNGSGCSFEEVMEMVKESFEQIEVNERGYQ
jgi:hypothetical protein